MGILDIFRRGPRKSRQAITLNGFSPFYTQFGQDIYQSDAVVQALKCIVDEVAKLQPMHVIKKNGDTSPKKGSQLQKVLNEPNPLMTQTEFIEKTTWLLLLNYNAFIVPSWYVWKDENTGEERRTVAALYPIQPLTVDFIQDEAGKLFTAFEFANGYKTTIDYNEVIHLRYNYSISEYMGGDYSGMPDNKALLKTLELNHDLLQGVAKSLKASYAVNGIVKYNTVIDDGTVEKNLQEFTKHLENNEAGFLPLDMKTEFTPVEHKGEVVDDSTLKFVDDKILRNFGVPLCILQGDYTKTQYEAFYQKTLEPIVIKYSQAFTKKLFTQREKDFGNAVVFYPKDLIFMSVDQTIEMVNALAPTGAITENEKRIAFGLRPLPELDGKRFMSLNWIDASNAGQYQVGKNEDIEVIDEEKTDM